MVPPNDRKLSQRGARRNLRAKAAGWDQSLNGSQ
jgi:hypothetical protein